MAPADDNGGEQEHEAASPRGQGARGGPGRAPRAPDWVDRIPRVGFVEFFEKYRQWIVDDETQLPFSPGRGPRAYTFEQLAFQTGRWLRLGIKIYMPVAFICFAFSFYWDFHGLIRSCAVAGMIGFGTNWVAIKMLFWPRENRPIFGQGLIPSQRDQLIDKVANEVLEKLINEELIQEKIEETRIVQRFTSSLIEKLQLVVQEPEFKADLRNMVLTYVGQLTSDPKFREQVASRIEESLETFAGSSFRVWLVRRLKNAWRGPLIDVIEEQVARLDETVDEGIGQMDGVLENLPAALEERREAIDQVLSAMLMGMVREVDVREIVYEQLSTVTVEQLEQGFREFSDDKLSFITLLGGVLGVIGGTVIIWPLPSMAVLLGVFTMMAVADVVIYPWMGSAYWPKRNQSQASSGSAKPAPGPSRTSEGRTPEGRTPKATPAER